MCKLLWSGISSASSTVLNIYYDTQASPTNWILANPTPIVNTVSNYTITNLAAGTAYRIKVVDAESSIDCKSIEILLSTLAV